MEMDGLQQSKRRVGIESKLVRDFSNATAEPRARTLCPVRSKARKGTGRIPREILRAATATSNFAMLKGHLRTSRIWLHPASTTQVSSLSPVLRRGHCNFGYRTSPCASAQFNSFWPLSDTADLLQIVRISRSWNIWAASSVSTVGSLDSETRSSLALA